MAKLGRYCLPWFCLANEASEAAHDVLPNGQAPKTALFSPEELALSSARHEHFLVQSKCITSMCKLSKISEHKQIIQNTLKIMYGYAVQWSILENPQNLKILKATPRIILA